MENRFKQTDFIWGLALLFTIVSTTALAEGVWSKSYNGIQTDLRVNAGRLSGDSGEYVYDAYGAASGIPGYKISELNWKIDSVYMLGIGASIRVNDWFILNADYWKNAAEGDGTMDDYDWLYVGLDWSHWSHHDDTTVTDVTSFDVNSEFKLFRFMEDKTTLSAMLGYKRDHMAWESSGGYGVYSVSSYRDTLVIFPNTPGISYMQTFEMPYAGLSISSLFKAQQVPVVLSASVRYSNVVHGEDVDDHHLRALRFEESGDNGKWNAFDIKLNFYPRKKWAIKLAYTQQDYEEIKASTVVTDLISGAVYFYPGASAGLDHRSSMISVGMSYQF